MKIVAGLGNPDSKYQNTYHNAGFMAVDLLADSLGARFDKRECKALTSHIFVNGEKVILAKPQTYMNLSGESIRELCAKYKVDLPDLLVIFDDIDIERGSLRIRPSGSGGTHNGMKSIVFNLGTTDFPRIRVGIGKPVHEGEDLASYVLSRIPKDCSEAFYKGLHKAKEAAAEFIEGKSLENIMQKYNTKADNKN